MTRINDVSIQIDRAEVTEISISLKKEEWEISISGNLISSTGHEVTTFNYSSEAWNDNTKIDFPLEAMKPGVELFKIAQPIIIKKIQGHFNALGSGEE